MKTISLKLKLAVIILAACTLSLLTQSLNAQNVAITDDEGHTADPSAMLDVKSSSKGMLVPRMSGAQRLAIASPADGLLVYDETDSSFFFYNGMAWVNLSSGGPWDGSGSDVYLADTESRLGVGTHQPFGKLEVKGDASIGINDPIFEVINANGDTVFAVYPEGVRIMVSEGDTKGAKGGFAVGGFGGAVKGTTEYMRVTPDSIRIYLDPDGGKGAKGGFAIGGFSGVDKGPTNEFLRVTTDSVRVYFDEDKTKGAKGGFAVGGFSGTLKGDASEFLSITPDTAKFNIDETGRFLVNHIGDGTSDNLINLTQENYFIGHQAGINTTPGDVGSSIGKYNFFMGYQSGVENTTGRSNIFMGYQSGYNNYDGYNNIFFGNKAGFTNSGGYRNIFFGENAGSDNTVGHQNIFIGTYSGTSNIDGHNNTFLGFSAGLMHTGGDDNVYIGSDAGFNSGNSYRNVFIGPRAGRSADGLSGSIFIGYLAGEATTTANYNTIIGNEAAKLNVSGVSNTIIGSKSAWKKASGGYNVYVGDNTGWNDTGGALNTYIGSQSGYSIVGGVGNSFLGRETGKNKTAGSYNVFLGWQAGMGNGSGSYNVFIGRSAGSAETGSNLLYIENSDSDTPLIYGDFDIDSVSINGNFNIVGEASCTEGIWTSSDIRLKSDISDYDNALAQVMDLRAVTYNWNREDYSEMNFSSRAQIGVIAQELEEVIPELVNTTASGFKSVDYARLSVVLLEAVKEQQEQIRALEEKVSQIDYLAGQLEDLQKELLKK
jgi:hypothetical protein